MFGGFIKSVEEEGDANVPSQSPPGLCANLSWSESCSPGTRVCTHTGHAAFSPCLAFLAEPATPLLGVLGKTELSEYTFMETYLGQALAFGYLVEASQEDKENIFLVIMPLVRMQKTKMQGGSVVWGLVFRHTQLVSGGWRIQI